ncbi:hypothetical protein CYMTET_50354 [Cymbomonas tetramitiformis]|uniref:Uncharacterized protein n=1 Tax=Cymbomonas tetramitiformis TaxID=36881 RepID=A0AAE0BPI4_9CHLO|nr:hypothetical protein CYMTET_50354 [Cymbomonas tetramitiformis]
MKSSWRLVGSVIIVLAVSEYAWHASVLPPLALREDHPRAPTIKGVYSSVSSETISNDIFSSSVIDQKQDDRHVTRRQRPRTTALPAAHSPPSPPIAASSRPSKGKSNDEQPRRHKFLRGGGQDAPRLRPADELVDALQSTRDQSVCDFRLDESRSQGLSEERVQKQRKIIEGRLLQKKTWFDKSCQRWGLSGEWRPRGRKIYYAVMVAAELQLLTVLLEEIFPVVDVIILQESRHMWRTGHTEEKELLFQKYNRSHFQKYTSKIRYLEYDFATVEECRPGVTGPQLPDKRCRWMQQWHARNSLTRGALDIGDHDIFVVADLDEMLSREFLDATKHCVVHEEMEVPGAGCSRVTALTFGHKYNFQCTALAPAGHYHPDLTTGRCLRDLGGEELRMFYGGDWNNLYKENYTRTYRPVIPPVKCTPRDATGTHTCSREGIVPGKTVGPVGWHMMSFLSDHFLLFKQFTRSGPTGFTGKWHAKDMEKIIEMKRGCNEFANIFKHDAWGCMPLPHLIREEPKQWRHFIEYVDVVDYPDPLGLESWAAAPLLPLLMSVLRQWEQG